MKKYRYIVLVAGWICCFTACTRNEALMTEAEFQAKTDSLTALRMEELTSQSLEELDHRIAIEVKEKTDSIVHALLTQP